MQALLRCSGVELRLATVRRRAYSAWSLKLKSVDASRLKRFICRSRPHLAARATEKKDQADGDSPDGPQPVERDYFIPIVVAVALMGYFMTALLALLDL